MIPCILLIALVCFTEILRGKLSPGKHPDLNSSIVAVIVLSGREVLLPRWLPLADLADEGAGPSLKLVLPLVVLSVLVAALAVLCISLGTGLRGFVWWSTDPH